MKNKIVTSVLILGDPLPLLLGVIGVMGWQDPSSPISRNLRSWSWSYSLPLCFLLA